MAKQIRELDVEDFGIIPKRRFHLKKKDHEVNSVVFDDVGMNLRAYALHTKYGNVWGLKEFFCTLRNGVIALGARQMVFCNFTMENVFVKDSDSTPLVIDGVDDITN